MVDAGIPKAFLYEEHHWQERRWLTTTLLQGYLEKGQEGSCHYHGELERTGS